MNILVVIRWVAQAWLKVKAETISKCFRKASVLDASMDVVSRAEEDDPFLEIDASLELQELINHTVSSDQCCGIDEYVNGDSDLPVCMDIHGDDWKETFLEQLGKHGDTVIEDEDKQDDHPSDDPACTSIKSYKEPILALVNYFSFIKDTQKKQWTLVAMWIH